MTTIAITKTQAGIFNSLKTKSNRSLRLRLQKIVANFLFPGGQGDWYAAKGYGEKQQDKTVTLPNTKAFEKFVAAQRKADGRYYKEFNQLDLQLHFAPSKLVSGKKCLIEVMTCSPQESLNTNSLPGQGKHIIYLPGANTYYQACFRDISTAAKETGATIHAFNFPGTGASTGQVQEVNDVINAGMAVVKDLLRKGVHPDNIILQGDCYGSGVALEVKKQFEEQSNIKIRLVMNNAFKSFKSVVCDMLSHTWLPTSLQSLVKKLLTFTGWHITPGKQFNQSGPYQAYVQHLGDQVLVGTTLADKVEKYKYEMRTGESTSTKRAAVVDTCPEDYKAARDNLEAIHTVRVKEEAKPQLREKFGQDEYGNVNGHFADLCECETLDGQSSYVGFVNKYLQASNEYVANHPQTFDLHTNKLPTFLKDADYAPLTSDDEDDFLELASVIENNSQPTPRML